MFATGVSSKEEAAGSVHVNRKRTFDAAFKLKVVACAEMSTNKGAASRYSIEEKSVQVWRKDKAKLEKNSVRPQIVSALELYLHQTNA